MLRRLLIVAVLCLLAAALGRPAQAAIHVLTTTHFVVSYDSDQTQPDFTTITQASTVAALAERALALEESWGFDAPQPAGGGKLVIDILDLSSKPGVIYEWFWSPPVPPASVGIALARSEVDAADEERTVASAVFMMIEGLYWVPAGYAGGGNDASEDWLLTAPAQWAGFKATSYALPGKVGPPEVPVDCHDFDSHFHKCATDGFVSGGDSRWPFYELLAQKFGTAFLKTVWQDAQASGALAGLGTAIGSAGGTLADTMSDYA